VSSFCLTFDEPLDWSAFGIWMTMLLNRHGENVLRIKGMLNVAGLVAPVLVNGVQHIVHPPTHLDAWPDADHRSRLIFITRDMAREPIEASLTAFNALANERVA
jgi:G3E family GTPase